MIIGDERLREIIKDQNRIRPGAILTSEQRDIRDLVETVQWLRMSTRKRRTIAIRRRLRRAWLGLTTNEGGA